MHEKDGRGRVGAKVEIMPQGIDMESLFLSRKEIGKALGMSERKARAVLAKYGVKPVDLGRGRGNGLRWRVAAVISVADTLHDKAQAKQAVRRGRSAPSPIQGRTAADLYAEFNGGSPPVQ